MLKRVFKEGQHRLGRVTKWVRCLKFRTRRKQSDHRAIANAVRLIKYQQPPRLSGGHS